MISTEQQQLEPITNQSPASFSPPNSPLASAPSTLTSHFVQALHDYLPSSSSADESASCLFFKKGSIIEVFNRDDSGWWDGQCGDVRGWFPSNYVGRIGELKRHSADFEDDEDYINQELELWHQKMTLQHHVNNQYQLEEQETVSLDEYNTKLSTIQNRVEMARALLREDRRRSGNITTTTTTTATTIEEEEQRTSIISIEEVIQKVADLVHACTNNNQQEQQQEIQQHVFQVVTAVRSVLTEANIVNKESTTLKMYPELARQRRTVLSALSRLVLKGKDIQQQQQQQQQQQDDQEVSYFADQLINEMEIFEKLLISVPRQSSSSFTDSDNTTTATTTTRPSSMFHYDTPRSSISSLGHSSIISTNSTSLRHQIISEAQQQQRHSLSNSTSHNSLIHAQKNIIVPFTDTTTEHILQNILDHQTSIDELMSSLVITLERYLVNRHRATEMLETTRKAVEAVRSFLAIVEQVCSNLGDLDYNRRISMIPEDPRLVALVLTKESVYSAITNLVTAVRALTGPQQQQQDNTTTEQDNYNHLPACCEDVVQATNECAACVRACLDAENLDDGKLMQQDNADQKSENSTVNRSQHTLSVLGRKITSLHAIQQYHDENDSIVEEEKEEEEEEVKDMEKEVEGLAITPAAPVDIDGNNKSTADATIESAQTEPATTEKAAVENALNEGAPTENTSIEIATSEYVPTENKPTERKSMIGNGSTIQKAARASLHIDTAVETIIPPALENQSRRIKMRARAASVNNVQSLSSHRLPPLPPKSIKPSVSAALPPMVTSYSHGDLASSQSTDIAPPQKSRRSRGLSVSSLRPSLSKLKSDRVIPSGGSTESLPEPLRLQKLPSWMSIGSAQESIKSDDASTTQTIVVDEEDASMATVKKEPEFEFLKQYVFTEEEMIFNADGEVTGATIEALVKKLTLHEKSPDLIFTRAFFYNFRLFTNPSDFVELLTQRFNLSPPDNVVEEDQVVLWQNRVLIPVRLRVYNVIKTWLETYFSFEQDAVVEKALMDFASNEMSKAMPGPAKRMIELITKTFGSKGLSCVGRKHSYNETRITMQRANSSNLSLTASVSSTNSSNFLSNLTLFDDHHHTADEKYPPSILNKSLRNTLRKAVSQASLTLIHVNDIDPVELARQITLLENNLFCRIRPNEMIGQEFKKKVGTSQAVHVKAMIQKSTQITSWVSDSILSEADAKKRAQVLKYWIKVGDACLQLNNYNTLMAIRSALDSTSIARLKKTWDYVSGKYRAMWEPIYRATDSQRNFAEYRQRLKTTVAPCLPFLGVYLTDMTFIDDGNANRRLSPGGQSLINFDKYVKITRILNEIDQFQISYKLLEVEEIQSFLKKTLETVEQDDQVFYARSLKREPKEEE